MKKVIFILLFLPQLTKAQIITTYAGTGVAGPLLGDNGPAISAEVTFPAGLNFDDTGNLSICQQSLVRKIDKFTGIITSVAGSDTATSSGHGGYGGAATCALIVSPADVCFDKQGNFFNCLSALGEWFFRGYYVVERHWSCYHCLLNHPIE